LEEAASTAASKAEVALTTPEGADAIIIADKAIRRKKEEFVIVIIINRQSFSRYSIFVRVGRAVLYYQLDT